MIDFSGETWPKNTTWMEKMEIYPCAEVLDFNLRDAKILRNFNTKVKILC